jgi:hypothetical protein
MPYDVTPLVNGFPPADARRTARAMGRLESQALVRHTAIDVEIDLTIDKVTGLTSATGAGMGGIGKVAQAQTAIEQLVPQASAHLNLVADRHALGVAGLLDRCERRLLWL